MDKIELSIRQVMADIFETPVNQIDETSNQDNIDKWDSLTHLNFVVALEEEFNIIFPIEEIGNLISFKLIALVVKEQLQYTNN